MGAGLSPLLIASASLTYLRFVRLTLVAVAVALVAVAVAVALVGIVAVHLVAIAVGVGLVGVVAVPLVAVAVAVALIAVVTVSVSGLVVVTVGVRTVAVIRNTKSTGKDELVTAAPICTAPIATAPVAAAAECRSASGRHRHVTMAMAAAVNATAANQLKENMSFAFIECLSVLSCFRPSLILNTRKDFWPFFGVHKYTHISL
jgi:hypothetical protein